VTAHVGERISGVAAPERKLTVLNAENGSLPVVFRVQSPYLL
jgi:hypothetical protein